MRWVLPAILMLALPACAGEELSKPFTAYSGDKPAIELLGALEIAREADGVSIHSLSALAWDQDESTLYALSDQARLYHFRPLFADGRLVSLDYLESHPLRGKDGDRLKGRKSDSEGAHVMQGDNGKQGDSVILIAFEQDPRIERYSPDGSYLGKIKLPKALRKVENYSAPNNALECVTWHPRYGVMTLPQKPQQDGHFLYSADGKRWPYAMTPINDNEVVSLEVMPDDSLLVMERLFKPGLFGAVIITLRRAVIGDDRLELKTLATLDSRDGWRLDNFEGLSRHADDRYFIVSDNDKEMLRRTLLYYFTFE